LTYFFYYVKLLFDCIIYIINYQIKSDLSQSGKTGIKEFIYQTGPYPGLLLFSEVSKMTGNEMLKTWLRKIPYDLGCDNPDVQGEIAVFVLEKEIENKNFLPHVMPLGQRAECAIPLVGESNAETIKNSPEYQKAMIISKLLLAKHYQANHHEDHAKLIEILENELTEYTVTTKEKDLIESAARMWT